MSTLVKILVTLGLVLPMGAFVAGSLAASSADEPAPRETIVIRDSPTRSAAPDGTTTRSPGHDVGDDHGGPEVVTPSLDDLRDDHGGEHGRGGGSDDRGGDDGGHGSDDSGSGGDSGGSHGGDDSGGGGHG
ncbi:hypothetical protein GCM10009844_16160 [Nocardioides koreensis]|uniref:Uncharacterized protein n=1 Tax=Nocardioides koreensis TaxID=433651 RepID=A0ABN2ZKG7_9ACTN